MVRPRIITSLPFAPVTGFERRPSTGFWRVSGQRDLKLTKRRTWLPVAAPGEGIHEDAIDLVLGVPAVGVNRPNRELDPCRLAVPAIDSYREVSPIQLGALP
jgi:hypothetical protein